MQPEALDPKIPAECHHCISGLALGAPSAKSSDVAGELAPPFPGMPGYESRSSIN